MKYESCAEIEIACARYFNHRVNIIVPNVWWGLGMNHECDLFVLTPAGFAYEVEIKTSKSDLKADLKKRHRHDSKLIKKLYFAVPKKLETCVELIPAHAGVLIVYPSGHVLKTREAENNKYAIRIPEAKKHKLLHLGLMRVWSLKKAVVDRSTINDTSA